MNRRLAAIALLAVLARGSALAKEKPPALPFIENDFDKALSTAKASEKPLFIEVWAPW